MAHNVSFISVRAVVFVHGKVVCASPPSCSGTRVTPERDAPPREFTLSFSPCSGHPVTYFLCLRIRLSGMRPARNTPAGAHGDWLLPLGVSSDIHPVFASALPPFYGRASSTPRPSSYRLPDAWLVSPLGLSLRGSYRHSGTQAFVCLSTVSDPGLGFTSGFGRSQGISLFNFSRNCSAVSAAATPFPAPGNTQDLRPHVLAGTDGRGLDSAVLRVRRSISLRF